jgi:hypothetical protein
MNGQIIETPKSSTIDEAWKMIPSYEDYMISNLGRVSSKKGNAIAHTLMSPTNMNGYKRIKLSKFGKSKTYLVHRLVLIAFIGIDETKSFANHKNGNRSDNRLDNLEWVTAKENVKHGFDVLGRTMNFVKPVTQYLENDSFVKDWTSIMEASKGLGLSHSSISQCCTQKRKSCGGYMWKYSNQK